MSNIKARALITELDALKREYADLKKQIDATQAAVIREMGETKSLSVEVGERKIRATRVQSFQTVIDESALRHALGASGWTKVSTRILDRKKLEAQMAIGGVDALKVAQCSTEKPKAEFVKLT